MDIIDKTKTHNFNQLQVSDVFIYNNNVYLKTFNYENGPNAFSFYDNTLHQFNSVTPVTKVKATLTIEPINYIQEDEYSGDDYGDYDDDLI